MTLRVFISHSNVDSAFAERLADDLRSTGADVWLDATHIGSGNFVQRINEAINARDVLVLVLTPDALTSRWVPDEMDAALVRYKQGFMRAPIIVLARPVPLHDIPALWTTYNRIDATKDYAFALTNIARVLGLMLTPAAPPPVLPIPPSPQPQPVAPQPSAAPAHDAKPSGHAVPKDQPDNQQAKSPSHKAPGANDPAQEKSTESDESAPPARRGISRRNFLIGAGAAVVGASAIGGFAWYSHAQAIGTFRLRWRSPVGGKPSAPAVANGMVYVGTDVSRVCALDAQTGARRWTFQADGRVSQPAVADGVVYVSTGGGMLYALDASAGTKRWSYHVGGDESAPSAITWPMASSTSNRTMGTSMRLMLSAARSDGPSLLAHSQSRITCQQWRTVSSTPVQ